MFKIFLVLGVLLVPLAAGAIYAYQVTVQRDAVRQLRILNASVAYRSECDARGMPVPNQRSREWVWVRRIIGKDVLDAPVALNVSHQFARTPANRGLMRQVVRLSNLRYLNVSGAPFDRGELKLLGQLSELRMLNLPSVNTEDSDLESLKGLPLSWLCLAGSRITDNGLRTIQGVVSLQYLDLSATKITDEGLQFLERLPNLNALAIRHSLVTSEAVDRFRVKCPHCVVYWSPP